MSDIDPMWVGVGGVISAIGTFIAGQRHGKSEFITAVSQASEIVITRLQKECERMEAARIRCEERDAECQRELSALKHKVDDLMHGEVPGYRPGDLRRVGRPKT